MNRKILIYLLFIMFILVFGYSSNAVAAVTSTCGQCHYNDMNTVATADDIDIVADFNNPNVGIVDKTDVCNKCHYLANHNEWSVYQSPYGWFKTPDSALQSSAVIHDWHRSNNLSASSSFSCKRCHATVDCSVCHTSIPHKNHSLSVNTPISLKTTDGSLVVFRKSSCATSKCHNQMPKVVKVRPDGTQLCLNCHKYDKTGHSDVSTIHTSTYLLEQPLPFDCSQCHKNTLNGEHESRVDANNQPYNCITCHKSTRDDVKAAITNHNKNCNACHQVHEDITSLHTMSTFDSKCQTCHNNILSQEHLSNDKTTGGKNFTCNTCHVNNREEVNRTIAAQQVNCSGCHRVGHNLVFADQVPTDIPLYTGFQWTQPLEASIFSGETGAPANYEKGQLVITERRTDVSVSQLWNYYKEQLTNLGWKINGGEPGADVTNLSVEFIKGTRFLTLKYFSTENSNGSGQPIEAGYRVEIWYK